MSFPEVGQRLRAYRMGSGLSVDEVADRLGISKSALYRFERGDVVKIDTLRRLAVLLGTSITNLLGVHSEFIATAVGYFERVRQIEEQSESAIIVFGPTAYPLTSTNYDNFLALVLAESLMSKEPAALREIDQLMRILQARKTFFAQRKSAIISLVSITEIERFLRNGFAGRSDLPEKLRAQRRAVAKLEVEHIGRLIADPPMGVQVGIVPETLPTTSFSIYRSRAKSYAVISNFRLGDQPNIRFGFGMITSASDALEIKNRMAEELWNNSLKGEAAKRCLDQLLASH